MKRTIFLLFILTVVVTSPPIFIKWAESQRLNKIQEIKQQARPVTGEPLEKVVSELRNREHPSTVILYTGNTKSHLEPCGCYQEQSGGLSRRAYAIEQIRACGYPTLVVDAGNIFDGQEEIDTQRCKTNIKALVEMGYSAVALSHNDLTYDDNYLIQQKEGATFPFLASTESQKDYTQPYTIEQVGQHNITFVAGEAPKQVLSRTDLIVALGQPKKPEHLDVVILPEEILPEEVEAVESDTKTLYVGSKPEGKTLGVLAVWINANGEISDHYATHIALTGEVGDSKIIRSMLTDFYRKTAELSHTPR